MVESATGRTRAIFSLLQKTYPHAHIALHYGSPWQLLVAVILSAQCTDVLVNKVTVGLFKKYKTLDDYARADPATFAKDIQSIGFFQAKAKNILATAAIIRDKFHGNVPKSMDELLTLPGVGRKTANVVLGNAFGIVVGIAVDTHVHRLSQRLRLVNLDHIGGKVKRTFTKGGKTILDFKKDADPNKIEKELMKSLPKSEWFTLTYRLIDHGRAICKAIRPQCEECVLRPLCPSSRV